LSSKGEPLLPSDEAHKADEAPARMFVFDMSDKKVAAVNGSVATFFAIGTNKQGGKELHLELVLQEPGDIQSLAFLDENTVITSVATQDSVVRNIHKLTVEKHEEWICDHLPDWAQIETTKQDKTNQHKTESIIENCTALHNSNGWKDDAKFW
jgi:hypothetical protein